MKRISLVQVNFPQGPTNISAYYLPYSVGCLWAYASSFEFVRQNYQLDHVIWRREPIDIVAQRLSTQDIVAFSTYVWNRNYNYTLARKIKEINSNCFLVFGGPEPAINDSDLFRKNPFMDAVIVLEGEYIFKEFLCNFPHIASVPGMVINQGGFSVNTGSANRIENLEDLPSPYLTGFFDKLIAEAPEVNEWAATVETNRGCPYQCTFCDWGSLTYNKVKKFNLQRVFAELEWAAKNRCTWIAFTDANFGMFVERDNAVLDKFLDLQREYGYPYSYSVSYAKNQKRDVLDMITKMIKESSHPNAGLKVSMQTLTEPVLDIIKRKNLKTSDCKEIFALAEQRNVPVGTEMILGLPGETLSSWKDTIWQLFDMGLHSGIDIFHCQLLENAEMKQVQQQIYDIKTVPISDYIYLNYTDEKDVLETVEVVISTSTMPYHDMVNAAVFNWFMTTCHFSGFTNYFSRFVKKFLGHDYPIFYDALFEFLLHDKWFMQEKQEFENLLHNWFEKGRMDNYTVHGAKIFGWSRESKTVLKLHADESLQDHWFDLLVKFMARYDIPNPFFNDVIVLQKHTPIRFSQINQFPKKINLDSNIHNYITKDVELEVRPAVLQLDFPEKRDIKLREFLERIYFTRHRNWGKAWISSL